MENYKSLPLILKQVSEKYSDFDVQFFRGDDKQFTGITYKCLYQTVLDVAAGLLHIGCKEKEHIGLIADNRKEWLHLSFGIMSIGAADVPRGCDATEQEVTHILSFSECKAAVLENTTQIKKVLKNIDAIPTLKTVISIEAINFSELESEFDIKKYGITFYTYNDIIEAGKNARQTGNINPELYIEKVSPDDIASIIFTSGTTGNPKGVVMTHKNFFSQLDELHAVIGMRPGEKAISVLPVWHSYERACEYIILISGGTIAYSKPIGSVLLADMQDVNPGLFPSVPRIWESVYDGIFRVMKKKGGISYLLFKFFINIGVKTISLKRMLCGQEPHFKKSTKILYPLAAFIPLLLISPIYLLGDLIVYRNIRKKLGRNFRVGVSGGGALPPNIDRFFWAIRVNVIEGYGITEAGPIVCVRPARKPVIGTLGKPLKCFSIKITDDDGKQVAVGEKGSLFLKGDAVTKGYYNNPEKTAEAISSDGWFDTGDIAKLTIDGELAIVGRKKNTIVLRGGENIEPTPIEVKLQESQLISTAVVVGQDQKFLGALIVVSKENLKNWADNNGFRNVDICELVHDPSVIKLYEAEIGDLINSKTGFKLFERIAKIVLLPEEFRQGRELSAKGELMRHKIYDIYKTEINELFL